MSTPELTPEAHEGDNFELHTPSRWTSAIAVSALAATAALTATALPAVVGGMNLGNHNETLLRATRRRWFRRTIAGGAVVMGGTAALTATAFPAVVGGLNLGNHNETLVIPT